MAVLCLAALLTGCGAGSSTLSPREADLQLHRSQWEAQRISSYRYRFQHSGFLAPSATQPVIIQVRDGVRVALTPVDSGSAIDADSFTAYDTVEKLFGIIEDAITHNAAQLSVQYDPVRGYPTQINIDPSQMIADEEVYLSISQLEPVSP